MYWASRSPRDLRDVAALDGEPDGRLHIGLEREDDVAAVDDDGPLRAGFVGPGGDEPGRPVVPVAGFVGVTVLVQHRVLAELDAQVRARVRLDAHGLRPFERLAGRPDSLLVVARGHHAGEDVGRLGDVENAGPGGKHPRPLAVAQQVQADQVDHHVGRCASPPSRSCSRSTASGPGAASCELRWRRSGPRRCKPPTRSPAAIPAGSRRRRFPCCSDCTGEGLPPTWQSAWLRLSTSCHPFSSCAAVLIASSAPLGDDLEA